VPNHAQTPLGTAQFKGVEKTVQAKMNELKAKEDALKQRENEMKLRGEQAAKQQAALAAAASSAAIIDEEDDDNVTATLRRIKSLPLQRKACGVTNPS